MEGREAGYPRVLRSGEHERVAVGGWLQRLLQLVSIVRVKDEGDIPGTMEPSEA
jgi:hypothetical protein